MIYNNDTKNNKNITIITHYKETKTSAKHCTIHFIKITFATQDLTNHSLFLVIEAGSAI